MSETGLNSLIRGYELLSLTNFLHLDRKRLELGLLREFYGTKCCRRNSPDFEKGFIRAETVSYEDFLNNQGCQNQRSWKMRLEGKDYMVNDGMF